MEIERFADQEFRLKTQQQLAKDFGQHGFEFQASFSEIAWDTDAILEEVADLVGRILERHPNQWMAVIYTIDLSEKAYRQFVSHADKNSLRELAWLLVKREAQKVYLRGMKW